MPRRSDAEADSCGGRRGKSRRAQAYLTDYNNPTGYAQSLQEIDPEERDLAVAITTKRAFDESGLLEEQGAVGYGAFHGDNLGSVRGLTDAALYVGLFSVPVMSNLNAKGSKTLRLRPFGSRAGAHLDHGATSTTDSPYA